MEINKMEIWYWLSQQHYTTIYDEEGEYKLYYELDMPQILEEYHQWKLEEEKDNYRHREMDKHLRSKSGIGGL